MLVTCNTRVTTLSVNTHCAENKYGMWMVSGSSTPPDEGPTSYHHLPAAASSGKCFVNTFTKITNLKQFFKLILRDPHLLEIKPLLQPSLVADSSPHHGSLLMVCSWLKNTRDTDYEK